jgi:hypothetical protein
MNRPDDVHYVMVDVGNGTMEVWHYLGHTWPTIVMWSSAGDTNVRMYCVEDRGDMFACQPCVCCISERMHICAICEVWDGVKRGTTETACGQMHEIHMVAMFRHVVWRRDGMPMVAPL